MSWDVLSVGSPQLIDNVVFKYIYMVMSIDHSRFIYICVCCGVLGCSKCGGPHS